MSTSLSEKVRVVVEGQMQVTDRDGGFGFVVGDLSGVVMKQSH